VTRRFRIIYSSFVTLVGETSINISTGTTLPSESFILDTVNFGGGGTYLTGITQTSNKSLFTKCVGIENTAVNGQLYMRGNTTPTIITGTTNYEKVLGTTSASTDNSKYSHINNRLTNEAIVKRKYLIQCTLSFTSGNNNVVEFGFYDSKLGTFRQPSIVISTANSSGRAENISMSCVVEHSIGNYIEIWSKNTSSATNITVSNMNLIITQIN